MDTKLKLEETLKEALRSGDVVRKTTIRMVLSALKFAEIERGSNLDETSIAVILQKEIKTRREAIQDAQKAQRFDLEQDALAEIKVIESFLPPMMPEQEIRDLISRAIVEVEAKSPSDMGKVMKILLPQIQGRAPNDQVSRLVRELLQ